MSELPQSFQPEDLTEKWTVVLGGEGGEGLQEELDREVPVGHPLHGCRPTPVAVRQHRKETIWWLSAEGKWAVVHLTWTPETDPRWPDTVLLDSWAEVVAELADRDRP